MNEGTVLRAINYENGQLVRREGMIAMQFEKTVGFSIIHERER